MPVSSGHDACPPTVLAEASTNVITEGMGQGRLGDAHSPHGCKVHPTHSGTMSSCSGTVFVNGRGAVRTGDAISCGQTAVGCASTVYIGD